MVELWQNQNFAIYQRRKGERKVSRSRLDFLSSVFDEFDLLFADDASNVTIQNPNYNENITIYDDEFEFTVCFSFQHRHFEKPEDLVAWIREIIAGNLFAIEFFNNEQRRFGSEIGIEQLRNLTYEKLEQFTGYYCSKKLMDVADSFKIRGWDSRNNSDFVFVHDTSGAVEINKVYMEVR